MTGGDSRLELAYSRIWKEGLRFEENLVVTGNIVRSKRQNFIVFRQEIQK